MTIGTPSLHQKVRSTSKPPIIKYWMTPSPHSIGKEQKLLVAHRMMSVHKLRHLPVLEHGKLVGILSERDLFSLESLKGVEIERDCVEDAMTQDVYCVSPGAHLAEVVGEMVERKYGCTVVIDQMKVVGIFTAVDALGMLAEYLANAR
ncbi:MAG: CBS domain-containing protein [Polyangiaceae bacterium]